MIKSLLESEGGMHTSLDSLEIPPRRCAIEKACYLLWGMRQEKYSTKSVSSIGHVRGVTTVRAAHTFCWMWDAP